jgi:RluA family pseudouridine synthase
LIKRYTLKTKLEQRGGRLDAVLAEWLPQALSQPVSKGKARKLIVAGAVYLNGKRVRIASKELMPNATVDVYVDTRKLFESDGRAQDKPFEMTAERVLFEDAFIIAVNKPPGLPTQPTLDEARVNLFAAVKQFLAKRDGVVQPYLALHHRLDRDTSGVILFAKAKEANAGVARMFSEHLARKTYNAIVQLDAGVQLPAEWDVRNHLGKVPGRGKQAKYGAVRSGGDTAQTDFRLIENLGGKAAWVEARPLTGRTHQIRVHLSEDGLPILGDDLYGKGSSTVAPRLMLHAANLTFPHPIHQTSTSIQSPLPEDFQQCIEALRNGRKTAPSSVIISGSIARTSSRD